LRLRNILILVAVLAVAAAIYFVTRPGEEPPSEPASVVRLWNYAMTDLNHIVIELPRLDMREAFIENDQRWYFDYPSGPMTDPDRWGGGIPLLVSGPFMDKIVAEDATEERLADFGFAPPSMKITLTARDGAITNIEVGDAKPDGSAYYIRLAASNNVYTIAYEWYDALEDIVLAPPYRPEEEE